MTANYPASILPPNATAVERAIDRASAAALERLPVYLIRWVKDPDSCPLALLPWLAWEYQVDTWNINWSEQKKRDAIKRAHYIHRHRGTVAEQHQANTLFGAAEKIGLPRRSRNWFLHQLPHHASVERHLAQPPLCHAFLERYAESVGEYQIRRLTRAALEDASAGRCSKRWQLERRCGLNKGRTAPLAAAFIADMGEWD